MKLTPCLELFFTDLPFPERIARVKDAGYDAAEFWGHANKDLHAIAEAARRHGVTITSMVGTGNKPGLNDPAAHLELLKQLEQALSAARIVDCKRLIVMSGNVVQRVTRGRQCQAIVAGLRQMAPLAEAAGVTLVIEYLNTVHDHPGYFLDNIGEMAAIVRQVNHPNVKALLDIYHMGLMEGDVIDKIRDSLDTIGHFHAAGIPGRHELTDGEQNYPVICRAIEAAGYTGYFGLEYKPTRDHRQSLIEQRQWING